MEITFRSRRLQRLCADPKAAAREWGPVVARKLAERLNLLLRADCLRTVQQVPHARCHQLTGDRAGQFAITVHGPMRIVFVVAQDPIPRLSDGGIDLAQVTAITVLEVVDYHG